MQEEEPWTDRGQVLDVPRGRRRLDVITQRGRCAPPPFRRRHARSSLSARGKPEPLAHSRDGPRHLSAARAQPSSARMPSVGLLTRSCSTPPARRLRRGDHDGGAGPRSADLRADGSRVGRHGWRDGWRGGSGGDGWRDGSGGDPMRSKRRRHGGARRGGGRRGGGQRGARCACRLRSRRLQLHQLHVTYPSLTTATTRSLTSASLYTHAGCACH